MHPGDCADELAVLLLHNVDSTWPSADIAAAGAEIAALETALTEAGHTVTTLAVQEPDLVALLRHYSPDKHIVFNGCEELPGIPRSEALAAQMLETLGFVYTGSPPDVLARSWDKVETSRLLDRHGLPTPRWRVYESACPDGWDCYPAIVKPAREHCSLGVTTDAVVFTPGELARRIAYVLDALNQPALVQDFIAGREFHVALWGNGRVEMLPPAEMDFSALGDMRERLCTYESKFCPGSPYYERIEVRVPAPLSPDEYAQMQRIALESYRVFGCRDYARLDLRLRDGVLYVLDVNPNPDISPETSLAEAARVAGYSYGALIDRLVRLAAHRHPRYGRRRH